MITMVATMILVCMTTTLQINSGLQEEINRKMANNSNGPWVFKAPHLVPSTVRSGKPARMTTAEDPPTLKNQEDLDSFSRHALRSIQKSSALGWSASNRNVARRLAFNGKYQIKEGQKKSKKVQKESGLANWKGQYLDDESRQMSNVHITRCLSVHIRVCMQGYVQAYVYISTLLFTPPNTSRHKNAHIHIGGFQKK